MFVKEIFFLLITIYCCVNNVQSTPPYPFQDVSLPWNERVEDLVRRLTTDEIVNQLSHGGAGPYANPAPAIPRLGISPHTYDSECLRGVVAAGPATSFPQSIGLAASFSKDVLYDMATAVSLELRAKNNNYTKHNDYQEHHGLSCFAPVINIMRHPTWGRNQETYGEDPYLSGQLASAYIKGLQGSHPRYLRASAGCKHFNVHGGPEDIPSSRFSFNANVTLRDWRMTFLPQFKECVRAGTQSLMCSYNSINGVPACANDQLLTGVLREEWGFKGYVVSDMEAIRNVQGAHKFTNDSITTAAVCLKAGTNLELVGPWMKRPGVYSNLTLALSRGMIDSELLYERVRPLFYTRMRLGEFDPADMNPYKQLDPADYVQSPAHRALAVDLATKTFVLLRNTGVLPLIKPVDSMAIVGPLSNQGQEVYGGYAADLDSKYVTTVMSSLMTSQLASRYSSAGLCSPPLCADYNSTELQQTVRNADVIVVCVGTGSYEHEAKDRPDMLLPGKQQILLNDVIKYAPATSQVIVLLVSGGPVQMPSQTWSRANAVIQLHYPAQSIGDAVLKVLSGAANPAGRLPYTWYADLSQVPSMTNYTMVDRTYRYMTQHVPVFPFGFGLSYTKFHYSQLSLDKRRIDMGEELRLSVSVQNTGAVDGDEVVQVYVSWSHDEREAHPVRQLVGFSRVFVRSSETLQVQFTISSEQLQLCDVNGICSVPVGVYILSVGGQQPDQKTLVPSNILSTTFYVQV